MLYSIIKYLNKFINNYNYYIIRKLGITASQYLTGAVLTFFINKTTN